MLSIQWPIKGASLSALLGQGVDGRAVPADPFDWDGCEPDESDDWKPPDAGEHGSEAASDGDPAGRGRDGVWPPEGMLADIEPGPLLAALVGDADLSSRESCPDELVVEIAAAAGKVQSWAAQIELAATAVLTDRVRDWPGVADTPDTHHVSAQQMAAAELGCALNRSPGAAMNRAQLADDLRRLPQTRAALAAGAIDVPKARMAVEVLRPLCDEDAAAVEATVFAAEADRVGAGNGRVHSQLRQALRRAAIRVNPAAYQAQELHAFAGRRMEHYPLGHDHPGMAGLGFTHHEDVIAQATDYIRALAKTAIAADTPGEERTLDQACADVFADLCTGRTGHTPSGPTSPPGPSVHVVVGAATLLDQDDQPAHLTGYGPISAHTARRIAADPTGTWRRLLTDPRTGRLDELSVQTYDIPADMDRHVRARDTTCRWPGCTRPARRCDTDHRIPWPTGPTQAANLQSLCRTHHRIKTHTRTTTRLDQDTGDTIVTLPSGHTYRRPPDPPLGEPDPPQAKDPPDPADDIPPF